MLEQAKIKVGDAAGQHVSMERLIETSRALGNESRKRVARVTLTLAKLIDYIKEKEFETTVERELIKMAKSRPHGTLVDFANNLQKYAITAQNIIASKRVTKSEFKVSQLSEEDQIKHEEYRKLMQAHFQKNDDKSDDELEKEMLQRLAAMKKKEEPNVEKEMLQRLSAMTSKSYESVKKTVSSVPQFTQSETPRFENAPNFGLSEITRNNSLGDQLMNRLNEINGLED